MQAQGRPGGGPAPHMPSVEGFVGHSDLEARVAPFSGQPRSAPSAPGGCSRRRPCRLRMCCVGLAHCLQGTRGLFTWFFLLDFCGLFGCFKLQRLGIPI